MFGEASTLFDGDETEVRWVRDGLWLGVLSLGGSGYFGDPPDDNWTTFAPLSSIYSTPFEAICLRLGSA